MMDLMERVDYLAKVPSTMPILVANIYLVERYKTYHLSFFIHH